MNKFIAFFIGIVVITGCEYIPHKVYEIETVGGEIIKLSCPSIEQGRSTFTYVVDGKCIVVK